MFWFDYQSVCHCSKTGAVRAVLHHGLTTSQFVTAPKRMVIYGPATSRLTTSQFVTAPKRRIVQNNVKTGLTTSQFVTAPKPLVGGLQLEAV